MHDFSWWDLSLDDGVWAWIDVYIWSADVVEDVEGVGGCVGEIGVSGGGGDGDKFDMWVMGGVDDGEGVV